MTLFIRGRVLYYKNWDGWMATVAELERVTKQGELIVLTIAALGDISHVQAEQIGNDMYRSKVPDQEGCILTTPDRDGLAELFNRRSIEIGEFGYRIGARSSRYWTITCRLAAAA